MIFMKNIETAFDSLNNWMKSWSWQSRLRTLRIFLGRILFKWLVSSGTLKLSKFWKMLLRVRKTCNNVWNFQCDVPVKNMTEILMEIPCLFLSQFDGSLVHIETTFHDYAMSFIQVLFVYHFKAWQGFWKSSSNGISTAFAKKMVGFPLDSISFSTKPS